MLSALGVDFGQSLTDLFAGIGVELGPFLLQILTVFIVLTVAIAIISVAIHGMIGAMGGGADEGPEVLDFGFDNDLVSYRYDDEEHLTADFGPGSGVYEADELQDQLDELEYDEEILENLKDDLGY